MAKITLGVREKARGGFTLVELLVVIAIIGILAGLLLPVLGNAKKEALKVSCKNNVRQLAIAAQSYATEHKAYPYNKRIDPNGTAPELTNESDARACLELLYRYNCGVEPKSYICEAAGIDQPAEEIDDERERRTTFHLEENMCSYTWRKKFTSMSPSGNPPLTGDKRGGNTTPTNHPDGRNVAYIDTSVRFLDNEKLEDPMHRDSKKPRADLIGFDRIGR